MSSRRHSLSNSAKKIYIDKNSISEAAELRVENLADSVQISPEELEEVIMGPLRFTDDNAERLNMLEGFKEPYLFCSDDLIKIVEVTPSLKTRMEMINMIAPRLVDPSAKVAVFTGMFRFSEEKHSVEEVLKARMNAINALKFTNKTGTNALKGGGGRGGAGRGIKMTPAGRGGGRGVAPAPGRGQSRVTSLPTNLPSSLSASLSPKANTSPKATPKSPLSSRPLPSTPGLVTPQPVRTASGRIRDPSPSSASVKETTAEEIAAQMEPAVLPDKRKNPEICPEDGNPSCPSPSSLGETDAETVDTRESGLTSSASATPSATASTSPRPATATTVPAPIDISAVHAQRPLPPLPYDSPHTDGEGFSPACNTPVETKSVKTAAVSEVERRPSASNTLASALFASVAEDTIQATPPTVTAATSSETASTRSAALATTTESARTTPVPAPALIEITARAPQRGPPMPSARRPVNGKDGASPVPGASGSQRSPSSLTPSTSSTNLVGMAGNNGGLTAAQIALGATAPSSSGTSSSSAAASSAHPTPAIVVAQPTAQGSYASQCGTYDLAPMVADCKPEVGVHKLLSKFSGSGGTGARPSAGAGTPRTTASSDATPMKTRNINDLTNAFAMKPATSTASSVLRSTHSSISIAEARSQAPAPIVIPGSTVSLAAMRAKFSGGGGGGGGGAPVVSSGGVPASGSQSAVSSPNRPGLVRAESGSGSATFPATEKKMVRRHSESLGSANSTFAAALAAANASMQAPVAAEVAGAGADLATRCAVALQMTKTEFLALTAEDALFVPEVITDTELPQYSYREVVRRNYHKEYEGLNQSVLELHVCDEDFFAVFLRSKAEYAKLPRWRQVEQKKKALLF